MLAAQEHGSVDDDAHRPWQQRHDATLAGGIYSGAQWAHRAHIQVRGTASSVHNSHWSLRLFFFSLCLVWLSLVWKIYHFSRWTTKCHGEWPKHWPYQSPWIGWTSDVVHEEHFLIKFCCRHLLYIWVCVCVCVRACTCEWYVLMHWGFVRQNNLCSTRTRAAYYYHYYDFPCLERLMLIRKARLVNDLLVSTYLQMYNCSDHEHHHCCHHRYCYSFWWHVLGVGVSRFNCGRWLGKGVDDGSTERLLVAELVHSTVDTESGTWHFACA